MYLRRLFMPVGCGLIRIDAANAAILQRIFEESLAGENTEGRGEVQGAVDNRLGFFRSGQALQADTGDTISHSGR